MHADGGREKLYVVLILYNIPNSCPPLAHHFHILYWVYQTLGASRRGIKSIKVHSFLSPHLKSGSSTGMEPRGSHSQVKNDSSVGKEAHIPNHKSYHSKSEESVSALIHQSLRSGAPCFSLVKKAGRRGRQTRAVYNSDYSKLKRRGIHKVLPISWEENCRGCFRIRKWFPPLGLHFCF